jgi:SulP family sulfate permease
VVNFEAGAETPAAGAFTAVGIALATLFLTPLLYFLPNATLAATIIVAVLSLVDIAAIKRTYAYSGTDFAAMVATIVLTLVEGVEAGLIAGVGLSIFLHLYRTSKPHVAVVGQLPGTTHFRNVTRHGAVTDPKILSLRVDASLYFPNARFLEDLVNQAVAANPAVRHVILECPAVNTIDSSALESLEAINHRLKDGGIAFHLSEVKGPVMDRLKRSHFLHELTGKVHLTQFDAVSSINPELARQTLEARRESAQSDDEMLSSQIADGQEAATLVRGFIQATGPVLHTTASPPIR